jgi:HPt (histidine-containing phosphotransfer) domain-containing protein
MSDNEQSWLSRLKGVVTADGIRYTGSEEAYLKFLRTFKRTLEENALEIENAYKRGDMELCTIKVHALKSSARIIGAREMSSLAEKLENAGKYNDMEFFDANIEDLIRIYRSYSDNLSELPMEDEPAEKEPISPKVLKDAYDALKTFVPQMDADAVRMILDEISIYSLPGEDEEIFETLNRKMLNFDWDGMNNLLQ